jgi:hypothetical protein
MMREHDKCRGVGEEFDTLHKIANSRMHRFRAYINLMEIQSVCDSYEGLTDANGWSPATDEMFDNIPKYSPREAIAAAQAQLDADKATHAQNLLERENRLNGIE